MGKNKYTEIAYENLQAGDIVITGGKSWFSFVTRVVTAGWKNRRNDKVATHAGIVMPIGRTEEQLLIAEMMGDGKRGLEINSLEDYVTDEKRYIIGVYRYPDATKESTDTLVNMIARAYRKSKTKYDYKGLIEFVIQSVDDHKDKYYCSEWCIAYTKVVGWLVRHLFSDKGHPEEYRKYLEKNYKKVTWRKE